MFRHTFFRYVLFFSISFIIIFLSACGGPNSDADSESQNNDENYPDKEVKLIVPNEEGGTVDLAGRALAQGFKEETNQSLVVDNFAGGAGIPGTMELVNADSDGYTLGLIPSGQLSLRPELQDVDYNFPEDFTPILGVGDFEMVFVTDYDAPYDDLSELVDYYKENDESPRLASTGKNTYADILEVMISNETDMEIRRLPFDGAPDAVNAVIGGNAEGAIVNLTNVSSQIEDDKIKVLGVPSEDRYDNFDEAKTFKEQGIDVVGGTTFSLYGPADLSEEKAEEIKQIFLNSMEHEDFEKMVSNSNLLTTETNAEEIQEEIVKDKDNISKIKSDLEE